ncbi:hypothetical protein EVAR_47079_1 [Eumeta japonica]|uniref:Uncharacterized protein n=1 Tax=Eumeta variegata TaxID=151549 RepID=A0A4C1WN22_EUMVA|nr:hypothetical protein EVAR_47079_1 [Eumeta japonica]
MRPNVESNDNPIVNACQRGKREFPSFNAPQLRHALLHNRFLRFRTLSPPNAWPNEGWRLLTVVTDAMTTETTA